MTAASPTNGFDHRSHVIASDRPGITGGLNHENTIDFDEVDDQLQDFGHVPPAGLHVVNGLAVATDDEAMALALQQASLAETHHDVPVGAVVVREGIVIAARHNERELAGDPTAHAEILAIRDAADAIGLWRLDHCTVYVTLEPCSMCAGALVLARVPRVVYGATDPKAGAGGSLFNLLAEPRLNHRCDVTAGVLAGECGELLRSFFASRRSGDTSAAATDSVDQPA